MGYREGDWKIVTPWRRRGQTNKKHQLFNLKDDIGEQNNLADRYPERLEAMKAKLEAIKQQNGSRS